MCGILGAYSSKNDQIPSREVFEKALNTLEKRGPDAGAVQAFSNCILGHRRLSIIDTSTGANQPFQDESGRYTLVFNGEIYNYGALRSSLENKYPFKTTSDTEVLLYHLIENGVDGIKDFNGFFAFAFYDKEKDELILARDRYGIKPMYIYHHEEQIAFASELKALMALGIKKEINKTVLYRYFQFNYIPQDDSILENVSKLQTGHFWKIKGNNIEQKAYFEPNQIQIDPKENVQEKLDQLLRASVERRMVADVSLGTFLSGGVDSSIISLIAKEHHKDLQTFSIGYKDEPLFDESIYAEKVAKHIGSKHHTFNLSNDVLLENMSEVLGYIDEPFADSSALAVYTLCKYTKDHVTVALSGDGSDEIFAGYNKHRAEWMVENGGMKKNIAQLGSFLWDKLPKSRNSKYGNIIRQLDRFAKMSKLSESERYMFLARFMDQKEAKRMVKGFDRDDGMKAWLDGVSNRKGMNGFLDKDLAMVLEGDMLVKVDRMSMANSLEVRVPFLDHDFVEYGRALSVEHKIDAEYQKKILRDIYYKHLPSEVFDRKKHGFEVPLLKWFKRELYEDIDQRWLNEDMLRAQGILKVESIIKLKRKLNSVDSGDVAFDIWKLIVFQNWYKKYFEEN